MKRFDVKKSYRCFLALLIALLMCAAPAVVLPNFNSNLAVAAADEAKPESDATKDEADKKAEPTKPITLALTDRLTSLFTGEPKNGDDLKVMQSHVRELVKRVTPCVVAVSLNGGMGSGVIISEDGYVLTAGHVVGRPNRDATFILHDGRKVHGKTLGANYGVDSGLMKITTEGKWPFVELGSSTGIKPGHWCLAMGHPGGFYKDRSPPVRLGRVLHKTRSAIVTDCTLVGGDSGGPLLDMSGKVIGIHSRIGDGLKDNLHVPINTYRQTWDRLVSGEAWGGRRPGGPIIGVLGDTSTDAAKISRVLPKSPAEVAGVKVDDVITKFDGKKIETFEALASAVNEKEPGDRVKVELRRGDETLTLDLVVGRFGQ